ncbi:MAG: DMT family transporter, partial [Thermoleophilia bacterium]
MDRSTITLSSIVMRGSNWEASRKASEMLAAVRAGQTPSAVRPPILQYRDHALPESSIGVTGTQPPAAEAAPLAVAPLTSQARRGLMAVIAGALCIAASPVLVRLSELEPTATGFYRVFLAAPLFGVWALAVERRKRVAGGAEPIPAGADRAAKSLWGAVVLAGFLFAADLAAWHWSLRFTTVANSTFIANLAPVFVTTLAWFIFRERVTSVFLLGMVLAIGGASFMVRASFDVGASHLLGDALALTTSIFYAGYLVSVKGLRRRLSTVHLMLYTTLVTSVALFVLSLATRESLVPRTLR